MTQHRRTPPTGEGAFKRVPSRDDVEAALSTIPGRPDWQKRDDRKVDLLTMTPGGVKLSTHNWEKLNATKERAEMRRLGKDDPMLLLEPKRPPRGEITEWSKPSQRRMGWIIGAVDYTPFVAQVVDGRAPAMTTLTLSSFWLELAPDGVEFKRLINALRKRYFSAWGREDLSGVWKLEFQRRGAPHFHLLHVPPAGVAGGRTGNGLGWPQWVSLVWNELVFERHVEAPVPYSAEGWADEKAKHLRAGTGVDYADVLRYSDPKRISTYFSKHALFSEKAYQNVVPEAWQRPGKGPGRFWGVWKLDVVLANQVLADNAHYVKSKLLRL